jgi:outer membrane autotransporter protein
MFGCAVATSMLAPGSQASAACTPPAGNGTPPPGTVVTCSGITNSQNLFAAYGDATQDGLTINVQPGASVNGVRGMLLRSDNTINNNGTIRGIAYYTGGDTVGTVINNTGTITSNVNDGIFGFTNFVFPNVVLPDRPASVATIVNNSGTISGSFGNLPIGNGISGSIFTINNSGTISGTGRGIITENLDLTNSGLVVGQIGVRITNLPPGIGSVQGSGFSRIFNSGTITGLGGSAIEFNGPDNVFTLAPTGVVNGTVTAHASDTFQLGGSGNGTFDLSLIGPAAQYRGFGQFGSVGDATWTLVGSTSQSFPWTVGQGTLLVNGSFAGPMTVTGGTLGGTGSVGATTVNGGTLSPGNSIGTITINGNLTFVGPGTYLVEVSPTAADRTNVNGTATLTGTFRAVGTGGTYAIGTQYVVLNAANGINGTFSNLEVAGNFGAVRPRLAYDDDEVFVILDPNAVSPFLTAGATPNQRAVAGAVDAALLAGNAPLPFLQLFNLTIEQLPQALDALSGEVHASVQTSLVEDSRFMRSAVLGRLRTASWADEPGAIAMLGVGGPQVALRGDEDATAALAFGAKGGAKSPMPVKALPPAAAPGPDIAFWGQTFGAWGQWDGDGNAAEFKRDLAGAISGVDVRFGNWRIGAAGGYTVSDVNVPTRVSSADVESFHAAGYVGARFGQWSLRGGAAAAWHEIDTVRSIVFPGFADTARASYDGTTVQAFGEIGYGFAFGRVALEPFAGLAWVRVETDGFTELGGAAALVGAGESIDVGYSTLGLRAATHVALPGGMVLIPRATVAWQHAFDEVTPAATLSFLATGTGFTVSGVPIARNSALVEAGLDLAVNRNATLGVSYVGQLADGVQDHAVKGRAVWRF